MLGFLKSDPIKKLEKEYDALLEKGMQAQRNGDIKSYSLITEQAEQMLSKIKTLKGE